MNSPSSLEDEDRGPEILIVTGILVSVAFLIVSLRVYVRVALLKGLGWDDHIMIVAMIVMLVDMVVVIPQVGYGAGRHVQNIDPPSDVVKGLRLNFVTQPMCLIALCLTKISIGVFLLRIAPTTQYRRFIWCIMIFTTISSATSLLVVILQCKPLAFTWDASIGGGSCLPPKYLQIAAFTNSSVSALAGAIFALLPIPMLRRVQLSWKTKTIIMSTLSLGVLATAAAIVKITFLKNYGKHGDFLFDSTDLTIWATIEICTAIVAASCPCLKPLFKSLCSGYERSTDGPK